MKSASNWALVLIFLFSVVSFSTLAQAGEVIEIESDAALEKAISDSKLPVLIDFSAPWCPSCTALKPKLEKFATQFKGKVTVISVNIDGAMKLAKEKGVEYIPSFLQVTGTGKNKKMSGVIPSGQFGEDLFAKTAKNQLIPTVASTKPKAPSISESDVKEAITEINRDIYYTEGRLTSLAMEREVCRMKNDIKILEDSKNLAPVALAKINFTLVADEKHEENTKKYNETFNELNNGVRNQLVDLGLTALSKSSRQARNARIPLSSLSSKINQHKNCKHIMNYISRYEDLPAFSSPTAPVELEIQTEFKESDPLTSKPSYTFSVVERNSGTLLNRIAVDRVDDVNLSVNEMVRTMIDGLSCSKHKESEAVNAELRSNLSSLPAVESSSNLIACELIDRDIDLYQSKLESYKIELVETHRMLDEVKSKGKKAR